MAIQVGDRVPDLLGTDQDGKEVRMSDYRGRRVALYFYPKDNTSGCTAEACSLRDGYADLQAAINGEGVVERVIERVNTKDHARQILSEEA